MKKVSGSSSLKRKASSEDDDRQSESEDALEKIRLQNIKERNSLMIELGLAKPEDFEPKLPTPKIQKPKEQKQPKQVIPDSERRKSSRIKERSYTEYFWVRKEKPEENFKPVADSSDDEDDRVLGKKHFNELCEEDIDHQTSVFSNVSKAIGAATDKPIKPTSSELEELVSTLSKWTVKEGQVLKVCSSRIQSILFHPCTEKRVAIAGSTAGGVGIWDIDAGEEDGVVELFAHSGPVNCLSVSKKDGAKIYSTSHDGTFSQMDIHSQTINNIYMTNRGKHSHLTWHEEIKPSVFLVAGGNGTVVTVDSRRNPLFKTNKKDVYKCFERSVRTVQAHPIDNNYFLASSGTGCCAVFDLRKNSSEVARLYHDSGLSSAFFSSCGSKILTTCNDHFLRVFDMKDPNDIIPSVDLTASYQIQHYNPTSAWTSPLKAKWFPGRNDAFYIASNLKPRRIQVFAQDGSLLHNLTDNKLDTICFLLDAHPTLPAIIGGNSSGKMYCFSS